MRSGGPLELSDCESVFLLLSTRSHQSQRALGLRKGKKEYRQIQHRTRSGSLRTSPQETGRGRDIQNGLAAAVSVGAGGRLAGHALAEAPGPVVAAPVVDAVGEETLARQVATQAIAVGLALDAPVAAPVRVGIVDIVDAVHGCAAIQRFDASGQCGVCVVPHPSLSRARAAGRSRARAGPAFLVRGPALSTRRARPLR